jgi:hypothetical protein
MCVFSFFPDTSTTATIVFGQASMTSSTAGCSASALNQPIGIALNSNSDLFVADSLNNRVVVFPAGSTTATTVFGQTGLTANLQNGGGESASSLNVPQSVAVAGNAVYIADSSNNRVL